MGGHAVDLRFYPEGRLHGSAHRPQECLTLLVIAFSALEEHHEFVVLRALNGKGGGVAGTPFGAPFGGQLEILGPEIPAIDDEEILASSGYHEGARSKVAKIPRVQPSPVQGT